MFLSPNRLPGAGLLHATTARNASPGTLSAREFEIYLRRERNLADRGSRVFTMIVLRRHRGDVEDIDVLAMRLKKRLRETDLVGRLDQNSLGILLTDTLPEGAAPIANFIDRVVDPLGLEMERKLYVYPSASEARDLQNGRSDEDHDGNGFGSGRDGGTPVVLKKDAEPAPGFDVDRGAPADPADAPVRSLDADVSAPGPRNGARSLGTPSLGTQSLGTRSLGTSSLSTHWSIADLWTELFEPLPLWKRSIDVAAAGTGLVLLAPFFLCVAIAIKVDSPGPIFFGQTRLGRGRRPFQFYKFRSMTVDAEDQRAALEQGNETDGPTFKIRNDPRKTRVGRLIRRSSVDELPQLWNVFRGDFSLVGPRPPIPTEVERYKRWQKRRLDVAGGLTCIWQVNGRSEIAFEEWMRMDMRYVARSGFWIDMKLLAKTLRAVLSGRGAY